MNLSLLKKEDRINTYDLKGLAYIKDSKGKSNNLKFWTICTIFTESNNTIVTYKVEVFDKDSPDYDIFTTTDYSEAIDKYNQAAEIWNGHRN